MFAPEMISQRDAFDDSKNIASKCECVLQENPNRWAAPFLILGPTVCNTRSRIRQTSMVFILKALTCRHRLRFHRKFNEVLNWLLLPKLEERIRMVDIRKEEAVDIPVEVCYKIPKYKRTFIIVHIKVLYIYCFINLSYYLRRWSWWSWWSWR